MVVAMTAAVAAGGCGGIGRGWSFGPSSTAGAGATTTTTELVTPSLQPAPAQRCAQLKAHQAVCLEWTPLEPQPSFADLVRLQQESRAPNGVAWGGLYLCGAVPEDLATRHLGGNYLKVIFTKHVCGLLNTAQTIDVQLYLGDPPLDSWLPSRPDTGPKERVTLHGRNAVRRVPDDSKHNGLFVNRKVFLGIPGDEFVIVISVEYSADFHSVEDPGRPDPAAADQLLDQLVAHMVELSA